MVYSRNVSVFKNTPYLVYCKIKNVLLKSEAALCGILIADKQKCLLESLQTYTVSRDKQCHFYILVLWKEENKEPKLFLSWQKMRVFYVLSMFLVLSSWFFSSSIGNKFYTWASEGWNTLMNPNQINIKPRSEGHVSSLIFSCFSTNHLWKKSQGFI